MKRFATATAAAAASLAILVAAPGCTKNKNPLETPTGADDTVVRAVEGVTVVAEIDAWNGSEQILSHVTPVRLSIRNTGDEPLRLDYRNFTLTAPDGTVYHALPPFDVEGDVDKPVAVGGPVANPRYEATGFRVAPYYGTVYPGVDVYNSVYNYDAVYYNRWYPTWVEIELPTQEMLEHAMPEGVLAAGGEITGFVYFERVDGDKRSVRFVADMVDATTDRLIGTAEMRFLVTNG